MFLSPGRELLTINLGQVNFSPVASVFVEKHLRNSLEVVTVLCFVIPLQYRRKNLSGVRWLEVRCMCGDAVQWYCKGREVQVGSAARTRRGQCENISLY